MRILVAHNVSPRRTGGMSRIMGFMHDHARQSGADVEFFCADALPAWANGRLGQYLFPALLARQAVRAARGGVPYDIINVHEPCGVLAILGRKRAGSPAIIVTSHGVERRAWELALEEGRQGRDGPLLRTRLAHPLTTLWQADFSLRHADHVLCLNEEDRHYLIDHGIQPEHRITRIFPGADPLYAEVAAHRSYERVKRLLFAATWRANKGIRDLVSAFSLIAERRPELRLILLGPGVSEGEILQAFPAEARSRVMCRTTDNERETALAFAEADIFVLPSLFEGTPLTLIEAMMSGLPIVTTATCGMKDVIRSGENGLLIPIRSPEAIAAAVNDLCDHAGLRAKLGAAARKEALAEFTWDRVSVSLVRLYRELHSRRVGFSSNVHA